MTHVALGQPVPEFSASTTSGKTVRPSDFKGKYLVLYFYPKDDTPGCTQEGQDFRDLYPEFKSQNAEIVGVSRDPIHSHDKFKCKYEFPFDLASDADESLCSLFDVIRLKNMYGKQVRGVERSTFLIDTQGNLAAEWRKVSVKGHAREVLDRIRGLSG
jgi:peroxiredoxin Q/BCP